MTRTCIPCEVRQVTVDLLQANLIEALRRLREHADELELQREHNGTLFALLLRRDRQLSVVRAELMQVRGILGEELRLDCPPTSRAAWPPSTTCASAAASTR